jgi:ABC-type multidrug transport system ATPase subunit
LLDEPTVNLDRNLRRRFADFLNSEILNDRDKTILMASHDLDFIRSLRMDEAWSLGNGTLSRITTIPESEGFDKPERAFPVGGVLDLEHVSQKYFKRGIFGERPFVAFSGLSVKFNRSIVYGITGPSGCGKSSMIKAILRLMDGTKGTISLDSIDLVALKPDERGWDPAPFRPFRRRIAVVQQDSRYSFFPDLKIASSFRHISPNGQDPSGLPSGLTENLARVGLTTAHLEAYPHSLSSGEMKRMDIARALTTQPEVLLLDEPFAHIDFETRSRVMHAISSYLATHETILIVVTHEDFDLQYFVDVNYDFPELVEQTGA